MRSHIGRRAFVGGSVAASAGLLTLLGVEDDPVLAQAHSHARQGSDPVLQLCIREIVAIRRDITRNRVRGEHARRHAAALRMAATYGAHAGYDEFATSRVRQLLREKGREAVLLARVDYDHMLAELRGHGVAKPEELPDPNLLTRDQRQAGIDEILRSGVTPRLAQQAELFERGGPVLDRYGSLTAPPLVHVAARQDPTQGDCEAAWQLQIMITQSLAILACAMPPLWELCVILQGDILLMEAVKWYLCSDLP